jgi:ADP-heptose:LPS heptosyltransferase
MVLLLPLLERIKNEWPTAILDIAVGDGSEELVEGVDGVSNIFVCGSHRSRSIVWGPYQRIIRYLIVYRRKIMPYRYDLAIAPRWGSILAAEAIYLAYFTGADLRIGYSSSVDGGSPGMDKLLTCAARGGWHEHETMRNLRLLNRAGVSTEAVDDSEARCPVESLKKLASKENERELLHLSEDEEEWAPGSYAVISPGATNRFNSWSVDKIGDVIDELHRKSSLRFYVIGSRGDKNLCEKIVGRAPVYSRSLAGSTTLKQVVGLISGAEIFIGMDSGPAHIAGALGVPTLVLSPFPANCKEEHRASPVRFRPCGPRVRVLQPMWPLPPCSPTCSFPGAHCIDQITASEVVHAACQILDGHDRVPSR